ncbi:putative lipase [Aspergillus campestris IBT 28561]|uniref:feruloyl esterase n=1 Tax=Aspergillus campestris (strain IBT 28561) TaxID=1392248 RepID=A0A2I1CZ74_ASPC2|nr:putative lipase [Aspergillus campestris IBT 28561]PKY02924.1 putative lipase [Aspergillus campestris IBT 28561]
MRLTAVLLGCSLWVSTVFGAPAALEERADLEPAAFDDLHRAAQLSSAAYSGCIGKAFDVKITKKIDHLLTGTQGYVGYSTERKTIAVVMKGSTTIVDILNDIDTTPLTPRLSGISFPSGVKIMAGVYRPWSAVHDEIIAEVRALIAQHPDYTLESTGHSLGGALTYMSYIALAQNFPEKDIHSNALAAFPIGNQEFADFGDAQHGTLFRGNNINDGVPNMYITIPWHFKHYGVEYYSAGLRVTTRRCNGQRDLQCSAGNGVIAVTPGHFQNFGVGLGLAGCGLLS